MTTQTKTMTAAQIAKTFKCDYQIKSIRKTKDGDVKVTLDNKAELSLMVSTKDAKYLMANSRAHQLKAMSGYTHRQNFLGIRSTADLPSTESAMFLVKSYISKVALLVERMIKFNQFTPKEAVEHGNNILAMKQNQVIMMICDEDKSFISEIVKLQTKLGKI